MNFLVKKSKMYICALKNFILEAFRVDCTRSQVEVIGFRINQYLYYSYNAMKQIYWYNVTISVNCTQANLACLEISETVITCQLLSRDETINCSYE